jgi:hypothetical protein
MPENLGLVGTLIGIDGRDGIVKADLGTNEMKILDMAFLAKYAPVLPAAPGR